MANLFRSWEVLPLLSCLLLRSPSLGTLSRRSRQAAYLHPCYWSHHKAGAVVVSSSPPASIFKAQPCTYSMSIIHIPSRACGQQVPAGDATPALKHQALVPSSQPFQATDGSNTRTSPSVSSRSPAWAKTISRSSSTGRRRGHPNGGKRRADRGIPPRW
ncbi:hypothetical protein CDD83_7979 [Cordyceps sp. RAO-2017]|nr:hypothetical protein CDD83_7979 [Cordyceps sp. RAO-2017]